MTGRRVYFSFHYDIDIWRASNIRNSARFDAVARTPWSDASLWEEAKRKGDDAIRRLIDNGLKNTSVTAVLIGAETASRRWVKYEIEKSIDRGNGLLGVRIHSMKDQHGRKGKAGAIPTVLEERGYPVYSWDARRLGYEVERAAIRAGKPCLEHGTKDCSSCRFDNWWHI